VCCSVEASHSSLLCICHSCACVAVCCSVLQCVAVCRSVSQCVAVFLRVLQCVAVFLRVLQCCSVLPCVAALCRTVSSGDSTRALLANFPITTFEKNESKPTFHKGPRHEFKEFWLTFNTWIKYHSERIIHPLLKDVCIFERISTKRQLSIKLLNWGWIIELLSTGDDVSWKKIRK